MDSRNLLFVAIAAIAVFFIANAQFNFLTIDQFGREPAGFYFNDGKIVNSTLDNSIKFDTVYNSCITARTAPWDYFQDGANRITFPKQTVCRVQLYINVDGRRAATLGDFSKGQTPIVVIPNLQWSACQPSAPYSDEYRMYFYNIGRNSWNVDLTPLNLQAGTHEITFSYAKQYLVNGSCPDATSLFTNEEQGLKDSFTTIAPSPPTGCAYSNPVCQAGYSCVSNQCIANSNPTQQNSPPLTPNEPTSQEQPTVPQQPIDSGMAVALAAVVIGVGIVIWYTKFK